MELNVKILFIYLKTKHLFYSKMVANFAMLIFCFWMLFQAAQARQETKPTRLTGLGKNCSKIPVALLDQCFRTWNRRRSESNFVSLEWAEVVTKGSIKNFLKNKSIKLLSLIICYTGSLATRTLNNVHSLNGMTVNSELFNVDNAVNNSLGKYCAGKSNVSWHGIKIHTEKSNGKNIIKLSTSLLEDEEQSFEIPDAQRKFIIYFGNKNEFSAYVTVDGGEHFEIAGDKAKREAFTELAPMGAHLKDLVGFWTLGLDMLPWMDHEVELFVNRSCSCSMEAWVDFGTPSGSELIETKIYFPTKRNENFFSISETYKSPGFFVKKMQHFD